ncbi:MAG: formate dehydrogenase [Burkholderiales bacterium]
MSDSTADRSKPATAATANPLKRRGLLIGAGAAGAAVLAVKALPGAGSVAPTVAATAKKVIDTSGGYQVTDHVLRYYETARA